MVGNATLIENEVSKALSTTLEAMSFSEVIRVDRVRPDEMSREMVYAHLHIESPQDGYLALYMPVSLASKLTEATFGVLEEEPGLEMMLDALGEFVNTITGCALVSILSDTESFSLGLPECGKLEKNLSFVKETLWAYSIDEEPLYLSCHGPIFA